MNILLYFLSKRLTLYHSAVIKLLQKPCFKMRIFQGTFSSVEMLCSQAEHTVSFHFIFNSLYMVAPQISGSVLQGTMLKTIFSRTEAALKYKPQFR